MLNVSELLLVGLLLFIQAAIHGLLEELALESNVHVVPVFHQQLS